MTQELWDELAQRTADAEQELQQLELDRDDLEWFRADLERRDKAKEENKLRGPGGWLPRCGDLVAKVYNQKFNEASHTADHFLRNHHDLWKELTVRECPPLRFGAEQLGVLGSMGHGGTTALPLYIQTFTAS